MNASTWKGAADLDATPPTVTAYAAGNAVSYTLALIDPRRPFDWLVTKSDETSAGTASFTPRVRPSKRTRILQVKVDASDPVGNTTAFATTLRLR